MFGPHFYYDLIRLARKRSNLFLRCGYLLALLLGWWFVYEEHVFTRAHFLHFERLATKYTNALLILQYALIVLLTPMYLAGTVMEEKEHRTLELLFQTDLSDREILLGKFSARIVQLMVLVQSSLPLLALISLWGGIRLEMVIFHIAFSLLFIPFVGSLSLWASVQGRSFMEALGLAYLTLIIFCVVAVSTVLTIVDARVVASLRQDGITSYATLMKVLAVVVGPLLAGTMIFYALSRWRFHKLRELKWLERKTPANEPAPEPDEQEDQTIEVQAPDRVIPDHALAWKETAVGRRMRDVEIVFGLFLLTAVGLGVAYNYLLWGSPEKLAHRDLADSLRIVFNIGCVALYGTVLLAQAFLAVASVAKERELNTLDFLLLLPVERSEIFFWKWIGPWFRNRALLAGVLVVPMIGLASGMFSTRLGLWLLIVPWPSLLLIHGLGMVSSVVCGRVATASYTLILLLMLILLAHLIRWNEVTTILEGLPDFAFSFTIPRRIDAATWEGIAWLIVVQQCLFLFVALCSIGLAYWLFGRKTSETRTQVW
jgi:ABC-type transport system involved in multi-copper enzyme maturation permease subunit